MIESFQKQPQMNILPAFSFDERLRLRETDLNEVVKTVESVLPQYVNGGLERPKGVGKRKNSDLLLTEPVKEKYEAENLTKAVAAAADGKNPLLNSPCLSR